MSRLRHALRDVTEVEEGHPSAAAKPAFRPNTGSMPVAHVAPLRKGTVAGEAPATGRSNVDSLSAATVAKLSDDELVAAFGLTPEEVLALRSRTRSASVNHANEATPQLPPSAPAAAPPAAAAAPEPVFPPLAAAVPVVATVHAVEDAAPAKAAAPLAAASIAARNALFGDDDDDDDGIFAPVAKPHAPAAASPAPQAPVAAIFADDEEGSLFRAAPAAAPKAAVPIAVKKPLFEDDDEDDGYVFARPAAAPAAAAPALPTAPPVTAAPVASKPLFDDDDDTESEPSKPVVVKEDAADDPLSSWQAAPEPAPPVTAPPPAVKPPVRAKALFDDDDDDDDSPLGLGRSMPSRVPAQPVAPPVPQPNRRGILDIGTGIGATDEDAVDSARAQESSEVVKAQMAAHLDELHAAAEDAEREAEHFQATFSALEQKLASLEAKAGGTRAEAREGSAASAPPSGLLFADDAQDESVLRAESLLSTLNLLTKPAGEAPAAAAAVGQSIFDDLPKQESKVEQVTAVVAPAAATPSPAKRSVLFDDSDDEELPVAPPPVSAAAVPAAADSEPIQHAPSLACEDEVTAPGQATPAVALPEPPSKPSALFDDEASEQVTSPKEIEAVADSVDITPPPPAPLPEQPPVDASHEVSISSDDVAAPASDGHGVPAEAVVEAPPAPSAASPVVERQPAAAAAAPMPRAPVPGGHVAAIAAAFAVTAEAPAKPAATRAPTAAAPPKLPQAGATPAAPLAASPVTVESVASGSAGEVKRPAPPARGPRRLISAPQPSG